MKKILIVFVSVCAIVSITNTYAGSQYPKVNMDNSCREQGITYRTSEHNGKYNTTVTVPHNSSDVRVQVSESSGESRGYDTRSNNVSPSFETTTTHIDGSTSGYSNYNYKSERGAQVDINCYRK